MANSNLAVFEFQDEEIRFVGDRPVANDVARVLGYADPADAVYRLVNEKNKSVCKSQTLDGKLRDVMVLEEPGIYQLIFSSKLPAAEKFQDWVFEKVLPSIRKTGGYGQRQELSEVETLKIELETAKIELERERIVSTNDRIIEELRLEQNQIEYAQYSAGKLTGKQIRERLLDDMAAFIDRFVQVKGVMPKVRDLHQKFQSRKIPDEQGNLVKINSAILRSLLPEVLERCECDQESIPSGVTKLRVRVSRTH
jgi:prophage antirepressor-like protein